MEESLVLLTSLLHSRHPLQTNQLTTTTITTTTDDNMGLLLSFLLKKKNLSS